MRARRGISLIEILFSVGVVGVGLLGVMALVPVAMRQVGQGNDYDRTSRMGLNALADFEIRGMANPENWRYYSPALPGFLADPPLTAQGSFAIDPLAMSLTANQNAAGAIFPSNSAIWMPRFTLRSLPQPLAGPMSSLHADRIFVLRDELVFNLSPDLTVPPLQAFNWDQGADGEWGVASTDDDGNGTTDDSTEAGWPGSDDQVTTRQADGVYSWMATMTPKLDTRQPFPTVSGWYPENIASDYILSIVVFRNRDFSVTNGISERNVDVVAFYGDGTAGGDVLLRTQAASTNKVEDLRSIREGNWILLSCMLPTFGGPAGTNVNYFAWYRVDAVDHDDDIVLNGSEYEINATLNGPDWPLGMTLKPGGAGTTGTQAALFKNVIAVYQKVVRLETSSLWSN